MVHITISSTRQQQKMQFLTYYTLFLPKAKQYNEEHGKNGDCFLGLFQYVHICHTNPN